MNTKKKENHITGEKKIIFQTGPQSSSDTPFRKRMRLHQSKFRAEQLKVDFGYGPTVSSKKRSGAA